MKEAIIKINCKLLKLESEYIIKPVMYNILTMVILLLVLHYIINKNQYFISDYFILLVLLFSVFGISIINYTSIKTQKQKYKISKFCTPIPLLKDEEDLKRIEEIKKILVKYFNEQKSTDTINRLLYCMKRKELYKINYDVKFYFSFSSKIQISRTLVYIQTHLFGNEIESLKSIFEKPNLYNDFTGDKLDIIDFGNATKDFGNAFKKSVIYKELSHIPLKN